jgi:hypothetical protein
MEICYSQPQSRPVAPDSNLGPRGYKFDMGGLITHNGTERGCQATNLAFEDINMAGTEYGC